ncbi:MAG: hypothetical protein QG621_340 [Patescibacteria group bacterium]|nr:hypothetical protein [Patescibacteria group bacterium]
MLIGFGWWWFLNRAQTTPSQGTGSFGTSPNKNPSGNSSTTPTNIGSPVIGTGQPAKNIPSGKYVVQGVNGQQVGNYAITPAGSGTYVVDPLDGAGILGAGNYVITIDNVTSNYLAVPVGTGTTTLYTIELAPYGTGGNGTLTYGSGTTTNNPYGSTGTSSNPYGGGGGFGTTTNGGYVYIPATTTDSVLGNSNTGGVDWLIQGGGSLFNPTPITQINGSNPSGSGGILPNIGGNLGSGGGGSGAGGALTGLAAAGLVGAATCGAAQLFHLSSTAGGAAAGSATAVGAVAGTAGPVVGSTAAISVMSLDLGNYTAQGAAAGAIGGILGALKGGDLSNFSTNTFMSCLTRNVAKMVLNQITNSVVNWINNGFNGSPAFVTNPNTFFANLADQAAGNYIRGSALSFLCSPFQLQIRIAVAQSYANRNANSCKLSQVIGNINGFMNGNFSAGGWQGFLAFTTVPTNNPYGAYAYGSLGMSAAITANINEQNRQLLQGNGFLDFKKKTRCTTSSTRADESAYRSVRELSGGNGGATQYEICDLQDTTPGHVIAQSLGATQNSTFTELDMAKSFDEIISALITQLVTRTLQSGLSTLSGTEGYASNFYTADQLAAQTGSQNLIVQMQENTIMAQNYAGIQQGSITDIQTSQSQLNDLYNCWNTAANQSVSSTIISTSTLNQQTVALTNAQAASSTIASLEERVAGLNENILSANNSISTLEQLQSAALSAASTDDTDTVTSQYQSAKGRGQIYTQNDVTNAQQNRTSLQAQLNTLNQQTAAGLQQCYAF